MHEYKVNESDVSIECDTVSVASHIAAIESDVLLVELGNEKNEIVTYNVSRTFESDAGETAESGLEEGNEIVVEMVTETKRQRALRKWRRRVRTLFEVFTCCVQQSHD